MPAGMVGRGRESDQEIAAKNLPAPDAPASAAAHSGLNVLADQPESCPLVREGMAELLQCRGRRTLKR